MALRKRFHWRAKRPKSQCRRMFARVPWIALITALIASLLAGCGGAPGAVPYALGTQALLANNTRAQALGDRVIVRLASQANAGAIASSIGAQSVATFDELGLSVLALPGGMNTSTALSRLSGLDGVLYAEPDY
ncbi:MAG: hypothetical protein KGR26_15655, partial [Cyanobacteria bacterium REEB65]|nr:hypothetical protein [Cyanobacteria bacterium REEB65]